jgi:hypothetical protein
VLTKCVLDIHESMNKCVLVTWVFFGAIRGSVVVSLRYMLS